MLKIGNIKLDNPVGIAPMAGVTDMPYRVICRELGSGYGVTELISAKAILYNNKNTKLLLDTCSKDQPCGLQLFGSDPEIMGEITARLEDLEFEWIDINMGCPVPKVVNNGEGSALMKNPKLAGQIVKSMVNNTKKPVTVKIRSGFDETCINAVEVAKCAQENGAAAVAVHARTRAQYYSGEADWSVIAEVAKAVDIPVIGNGDIASGLDILKMKAETNCQGFMIGRAARGNPWIFKETAKAVEIYEKLGGKESLKEALSNESFIEECKKDFLATKPSMEERKAMMIRHSKDLIEEKGEFTAVRELRKHFGWYSAGLKHAVAIRREVNQAESLEELIALINLL